MFIYKITNKINNKLYIGQTIRPVEQRFQRHVNDAINNKLDTHFARAIRKYGKENFIIEIIDIASTQEELTQKEYYWINIYDTANPKIGYNETNEQYKCGGNTYLSKTDSEMLIIEEKIRQTKIGNKNPNAKSIKCRNINTLEELYFDTMKECQEYFGETNHQFISRRCLGKLKNLYQKQWQFAYIDKEYFPYSHPNDIKTTRRHILVENLETNEIKEFKTYSSAEKYYNLEKRELSKITHLMGDIFIVRNKYKITVLN